MVILVPAVLEVRRRAGRGWERGERARGYDVSEGLYESLVSGTSVDGSEVDLVPARASERVPVHGHRRNVTAGRGDTQLVAGRGLRGLVSSRAAMSRVCAIARRAPTRSDTGPGIVWVNSILTTASVSTLWQSK